MGRTVFLAENLFSRRIFPSHTLTASPDTESGLDPGMVGTARRQRELNRWSPATPNVDAYLELTFDRVRSFDTLFLDRGHNLQWHDVSLRVSSDDFGSYTEIGPVTIPENVYPYSRLTESPGVLTEEYAWGWRFGTHAGLAVRLFVSAMGPGLKPEVVGAYLGRAFRPEHAQVMPFDHGKVELLYEEERSPQAQVAAGEIGKRRRGEIHLRLASRDEYALARYHIEGLFLSRVATWIVPDDEEAEKARLAYAPPGVAGFEIGTDWSEFQGRIPWIEHEPQIV